MKTSGRSLTALTSGLVSLSLGAATVAEAQPPIRIGASVSQTGAYGLLGQNQLRGYQLCDTVYAGFKVDREGVQVAYTMLMFQWQDGKKVIVWPDEVAPGKPSFPTSPWSQRP